MDAFMPLFPISVWQGATLGDRLVKKFPTVNKIGQPTYFRNNGGDSSPTAIANEYSGFLARILSPESEM